MPQEFKFQIGQRVKTRKYGWVKIYDRIYAHCNGRNFNRYDVEVDYKYLARIDETEILEVEGGENNE